MKRIFNLSLLLLALLLPATASACDFEVDGIYYNITNDNEVAVTYEGSSYSDSYNEYSGEVSIPATVTYNGTTYSVTSIGNDAFRNCTGLTSVTIPNSITEIGSSAFYNCSGLTGTLTLPETLSYIGPSAFYWASNIEAVICCAQTPPSWNYLGMFTTNVFNHSPLYVPLDSENAYMADACWGQFVTIIGMPMNKATEIMLNQSQKTMQVGITSQLTAIVLPESTFNKTVTWTTSNSSVATVSSSGLVTAKAAGSASITATTCDGSNLSATCALTVTSQNTPQGSIISFADANVKTVCIQNWDTNGDGELDIEEAKSVTTLDNAFILNKSITSFDELQYFTGLTSINYNAFKGCTGLKSITIPNNVTVIGQSSFYGCSDLESITIPNNVTKISKTAFFRCSSLKSITIPNNVTYIGYAAFSYCSGLKSITIPSSVTSIGDYAFIGCSGLESIIVETNNDVYDSRDNCNAIIKKANNELIAGCKTTVIPSSVTSIAKYTFSYCDGLTSITIPSSVTCIDSYVFESCTGLKSITIPSSVTAINYHAFYGCSSLTNVYSFIQDLSNVTLGDSIFHVGSESFDYSGRTLHVPAGSLAAYQANSKWSECFGTIVEMPAVVLANSIALDQTDVELAKGNILQLSATVMPDDAADKSVTWTTSDEAVATVDATGLVTAVDPGTATITATTTDGSNLSASCDVTVTEDLSNYDNYLSMENVEAFRGDTIVIPVKMTNETSIISFQTDIFLPDGLELLQEDGEYIIDPSDRMTRTHSIMSNDVSNGAIRVLCYSSNYKPFTGNSGDDLFYITVKVADDAEGNYTIQLKNTLLTNTDFVDLSAPDVSANVNVKAYLLGDANNSGTVSITDVVVTAQYVLELNPQPFVFEAADANVDGNITVADVSRIAWMVLNPAQNAPLRAPALWNNGDRMSAEDITLAAGEIRKVSILLDNEMDYSAFQLDLNLPEGLTASNFKVTDRAGSHAFDVNTLQNGNIRALCYSPALTAIHGHEGALLTFDVTAAGSVNGNILVNGIELVTTGCQSVKLDAFTIGVNNESSINESISGKTIAKVEYFNMAGQRVEQPSTGVTLVVTTYTDGSRTTSKVIK